MLEDPVLMDKEFGVLSLHPAAFMNEEELEVLIAHYGCEQTHGWEEDREDHQMTKLLINAARKCPVWLISEGTGQNPPIPRIRKWI